MNKDLLKKKIKDGYQDLSQFDFKQLDFRESGEWPKSVRIIFALMFIASICAAGYFVQFKRWINS